MTGNGRQGEKEELEEGVGQVWSIGKQKDRLGRKELDQLASSGKKER